MSRKKKLAYWVNYLTRGAGKITAFSGVLNFNCRSVTKPKKQKGESLTEVKRFPRRGGLGLGGKIKRKFRQGRK